MYTITIDGATLYNPRGGDDNSLLDAVLSLEDNKSGSFEFTVPVINSQYGNVSPLLNRIVIFKDDVVVWVGRPIKVEIDWNLNKRVTCEGWIGVLRDAPITKYAFDSRNADKPATTPLKDVYRAFFSRFNEFMDTETGKYVEVGECDFSYLKDSNGRDEVTTAINIGLSEEDRWENTYFDLLYDGLDAEEGSEPFPQITDSPYNGHIVPHYSAAGKTIVDILEDDPEEADQKIEFGKNLLDLSQYIDPDESYSVIYPYFGNTGVRYLDGEFSPRKNVDAKISFNGVSGSNNGMEYTRTENGWTLNGETTAASTWDILSYRSGLPDGLIAGKTYTLDTNIVIRVGVAFFNGETEIDRRDYTLGDTFTVPPEADGITMYFTITNGVIYTSQSVTVTILKQSFVDGKTMENPAAIRVIGRIVKPIYINLRSSFDSDTQEKRDALARPYLAAGFKSGLTINISALDLSLLGVDVDSIEILKKYEIVSAPHDFHEVYQCTAVRLNLLEPQDNEYQFGATRETLTSWVEKAIKNATTPASTDETEAT